MSSTSVLRAIALAVVTLAPAAAHGQQWTWTTLDYPGATSTWAWGIDGNNIVGQYQDGAGSTHGFLYNGASWITLDYPGAINTWAKGISGTNIVGDGQVVGSNANGFIYSGTTWTRLDYPAGREYLCGIDGDRVVGWCNSSGGGCGLLYNGTSWTVLNCPFDPATWAYGVSGTNIVGQSGLTNGFLYDGTTWTLLSYPGASQTIPWDIAGNYVVGKYSGVGTHGFLYDGATWLTVDYPGATFTTLNGISGSSIVGGYTDGSGNHGFLLTIPEPATLLLLAVGCAAPLVKRRQRRRSYHRRPE